MIAIIDYGLGNIKAFANVYHRLNMQCSIVSNANELKNSTKIILPGVGAFDTAMERLEESGMRDTLDDLVFKHNLPILGVCVGMQMLAKSSDEGKLPGLGWIDGVVKRIDTSSLANKPSLPHMGWNNVTATGNNRLFQGLNVDSRFYFLHSYYFQCQNKDEIIAETDYGSKIPSAVNKRNIYGVQFHPEKSHQNGIQILKNFGNL